MCIRDRANPADGTYAALYLLAYTFLLRLPSEALPVSMESVGSAEGKASALYLHEDTLYLKLARRKNKDSGALMKRTCWCNTCTATCPVHVLWAYFKQKTAYEIGVRLVGSEMCIRDRVL